MFFYRATYNQELTLHLDVNVIIVFEFIVLGRLQNKMQKQQWSKQSWKIRVRQGGNDPGN